MTYSAITKESIFAHVSQEQIFERYLGEKVVLGKKYCSPLRKDKNPTCGFAYARSGKLYFKDFSGHFWGDCLDLVMVKYGWRTLQPVLEKIAQDFNILQTNYTSTSTQSKTIQPLPKQKEKTIIQIQSQPYQSYDAYFWKRLGVTSNTLKNVFNTSSVKAIWINGKRIYTYHPKDPAIAYCLGPNEYKIYFPERSDNRFICNTNKIQGWDQLPQAGKLVVITKSMKDVIVLFQFGIRAVAWQGEGIVPDQEKIEELKNRFDSVVSLYDFDLTGIRTANKLKKRDGITPYFFTNGRFSSINYGAKDPAEYVWNHGIPKAKSLRDTFINIIKNEHYSRNTQLYNPCSSISSSKNQILQTWGQAS